ncbi:MAG: N-glycosylase/DNA lyase [Candidatus Aenigmarchaeota archaeon]|nr:N-glycosylase/DNA lyase [Candidatus Aenigmarchaeota archaeon]
MKMLRDSYRARKNEIETRLADFRNIPKTPDSLFAELVFCLLTPQSKAVECDKAVRRLIESRTLFKGAETQVNPHVRPIRFHNQKTKSIVEAREHITKLPAVAGMPPLEAREWLVANVRGLGYKEASHFLRNIGSGEELAILDRHILKNLVKHRAIKEVPKTLTRKKYMEIEQKMKEFSRRVNVPIAHLDLLFWSEEAGRIFK